jgi:hypothetical protein
MTEQDDRYDDDLIRALRAPGTDTELANQERYVAAFRAASTSRVRSLPRRTVGRLGAGGTAVVVTVALTSGVAAAYTGHLPDPVQRLAHTVIGAPAPDLDPGHHSPAPPAPPADAGRDHRRGIAGATSTTGPTQAPSSDAGLPTPAPTSPAGAAGTTDTRGAQPTSPTGGPSSGPAGQPSVSTTGSSGGSPASAMSMSAPTHRVGVGQTLGLTGLVTDASGTALPGRAVVLQARGPLRWRRVAESTTDSSGAATATTPAITRSTRFRWKAAPGVTSIPWIVRMVPTLTLSAQVGGTTTTLTATADGTVAGDRFRVFKRVGGRITPLGRHQLEGSGTADVVVRTPRRRTTYVVRLVATPRHTAARARVQVTPPEPASVSVAGSASRVSTGTTAAVSGTDTSATGAVLPGHTVVLLRRGASTLWRRGGHAVSDSAGHVTIPTPAISATARFRLHTDHGAHSAAWRIVAVPSVGTTAERDGSRVSIAVTTTGARAGDTVALFRIGAEGLVRLQHTTLSAEGRATFSARARAKRTTYVVRLPATRLHGAAGDSVTVPGSG